MKNYNAWRISSIFFLLLTNFAIQMRSDENGRPNEFLIPPQSSLPFAAWYTSDTYTVGSTFERNLVRVMNDLAQNTSQTGFNTSSYGQNPNKVYGLLQCRGNASQSQCRQCAKNVTRYAIGISFPGCHESIDCQMWLDLCYVRYANYSFISVFQKDALSFEHYGSSHVEYSKSPDMFRNTLLKLLSNLSAEASQDVNKRFAAQSANYSTPSPEKVDAFVECSRDLSSGNCSACLARGVDSLKPIAHLQAQFYHRSCLVRYVSTEWDYGSTEPGNSASKQRLIMWGLIRGLLLSIFAPICA